jgi:hypothetical protein
MRMKSADSGLDAMQFLARNLDSTGELRGRIKV